MKNVHPLYLQQHCFSFLGMLGILNIIIVWHTCTCVHLLYTCTCMCVYVCLCNLLFLGHCYNTDFIHVHVCTVHVHVDLHVPSKSTPDVNVLGVCLVIFNAQFVKEFVALSGVSQLVAEVLCKCTCTCISYSIYCV